MLSTPLLPVLMLLATAQASGCDPAGWSWAPVFFRAVGSLYQSGDCTGSASTCSFNGAYGWNSLSATITCPSPTAFNIKITGPLGVTAEEDGPANSCVGVGFASAKVACQPGLLLILVPLGLVLLLTLCCYCCGCCCCQRSARAEGATYIVLPQSQQVPLMAQRYPEPTYLPVQQGRGYRQQQAGPTFMPAQQGRPTFSRQYK